MKITDFETEEYFSRYEFKTPYLISASDCETISIEELIQIGGGSPQELVRLKLGYTEMPGSAALRDKISSLYETVDKSEVLVLGSPIEGIYLGMRTFLSKGDHVIVLSPAYDALFNLAAHITGNASRWFLKNDGKKWSLDFVELERLLSTPTKLMVINFPHNPTGFLPSKKQLDKIVEIAERNGAMIFSDEMYRGLEYEPGMQLKSLADTSKFSITLGGVSKNLGLPGLRFGWLIVKNPSLYKELLNYKSYTTMCPPQTLEYLGTMAIQAFPQIVKKNLDIIKSNLPIAEAFFGKWKNYLQWIRPQASSISVVKTPEKSAEIFCHNLAQKFGVVLLPIKFMGYEDQYVRIGLGRKNFASNLEVFDCAMNTIFK